MPKRLIMINGPMGVGKTATSLELQKLLPQNVFLDGDWCWAMSPFIVTDETKAMVQKNICYLLNQFLACSEYQNIIFCWVMDSRQILESIMEKLDLSGCSVSVFTLLCSAPALRQRLENDIAAGKREKEIIERSLCRLPNYGEMDTIKIEVSERSPKQAAMQITAML